jgi:hypothetical protein
MENFLLHFSSTMAPGDLAITLRNLMFGVAVLVAFALPSAFVLSSRKLAGKVRVAWFVATLLLSWPAYVVFAVLYRNRPKIVQDLAAAPAPSLYR